MPSRQSFTRLRMLGAIRERVDLCVCSAFDAEGRVVEVNDMVLDAAPYILEWC